MNSTDFYHLGQSAVSCATAIAEVILLIRLAWLGLIREFKIFSLFLAFDAAFTLTLLGWDYHAYSYERIWTVVTPVWTLLLAGAALELSRGLRQAFPRETINRGAALYGFLIGMTVSVGAAMLTHPQAIMRSAVLLMNIGRTAILSGCIVGILAQGVCLFIGSAPVMANWRLHRRILLAYFTAFLMASLTINSRNRHFAEWISLLSNVSLFGCFCGWITALRPAFSHLWDGVGYPTEDQVADNIVFYHQQAVLKQSHRRLEDLHVLDES